jgi:hypothetical protein
MGQPFSKPEPVGTREKSIRYCKTAVKIQINRFIGLNTVHKTNMESELTLNTKIMASNLMPQGAEAPIRLGKVLPTTREQPVNPRVRVRVFRVRVWVGRFVPQPVSVSIPS